jgi:hypothetical protein
MAIRHFTEFHLSVLQALGCGVVLQPNMLQKSLVFYRGYTAQKNRIYLGYLNCARVFAYELLMSIYLHMIIYLCEFVYVYVVVELV